MQRVENPGQVWVQAAGALELWPGSKPDSTHPPPEGVSPCSNGHSSPETRPAAAKAAPRPASRPDAAVDAATGLEHWQIVQAAAASVLLSEAAGLHELRRLRSQHPLYS